MKTTTYFIRLYELIGDSITPISEPIGGSYYDLDYVEAHTSALNAKLGHLPQNDGLFRQRKDCSLVFMFDVEQVEGGH